MRMEELRKKALLGLECCMAEKICASKCPYKGQCDDGGYYYSKAIEDAISLLKAQEPRVMTLEEAMAQECGTVLWVEEAQNYVWNLFPLEVDIISTHPDTGTYYLFFIAYHDLKKFEGDEYGTVWRCWSARPTEEQRKAEPWHDQQGKE